MKRGEIQRAQEEIDIANGCVEIIDATQEAIKLVEEEHSIYVRVGKALGLNLERKEVREAFVKVLELNKSLHEQILEDL